MGGIMKLFGGGSAPKPISVKAIEPKPVTMPTPDDTAAREARRKLIAAQASRGGRASTILTDSSTYGNTLLGQ